MIQLQILCLLFALAMLYWSYLSYKRHLIRVAELVSWMCVWGGVALVVVFPESTTIFLEKLRINRTMDLLVVLGLMVVWIVLFANHLENRRLRRKLQDLVREIAIRDTEKQ
jgi:hypothetical protein